MCVTVQQQRLLLASGARVVVLRYLRVAKVDFVDSYAPKGHDACATPARRWVEGQVPASPAVMFHPDAAGMKAQAKMIVKRLQA